MSVKIESTIKKIYPSISELSSIQSKIPCSEDGCDMVFKSHSNFTMHLTKHHKKEELEKNDLIRQFHCPDSTCQYHDSLHFDKIKYLKQHYLKVHAEKTHICDKCSTGFSTENAREKHEEICGVNFTCSECMYSYSSYEALTTHSRRKNHKILSKTKFRTPKTTDNTNITCKKQQNILPKPVHLLPVVFVVKSDSSSSLKLDKECQTDKTKSSPKRKSTQQTQTYNKKKSRICAETQTIGDCILKRAIQEAKIKEEERNTQTSGNFDIKQTNFNFLNENIMHSSCQTSLDNINIFEESFGNCNSQTQTDLIFQDEFLQSNFTSQTQTNDQSLDLSHMYTQTCEDQLLSELEFTNIQTQTNWPDYDMFVSTETQTLLTHNTKSVLDMALTAREISHMETQTDMEFKQLLEEINA